MCFFLPVPSFLLSKWMQTESKLTTKTLYLSGPECRRNYSAEVLDMLITCNYRLHMSKMVQIRNVPDEIHRKLKARAALAGMTLSDYLLAEARRIVEKPSPQEMAARLRQRLPVEPAETPAEAVRKEREKQ